MMGIPKRARWFGALLVVALVATSVSSGLASADTAPGAAFVSDDFNAATLDPMWQVVDPVGDGSVSVNGSGTGDAHLVLSVPAGVSHDPWRTNRALRVMQPAANVDFGAELAFASVPSLRYQTQGLIVQQDATNWLRFDLHSDGTRLRAFGARTVNGSSAAMFNVVIPAAPASQLFMRVTRTGSQWAMAYSYDGIGWTTAGTFSHPLSVSSVGPFAANSGLNPAFAAVVDYVFDLSAPIIDEDGVERPVLSVTADGEGTVERSPDLPAYDAGTVVTLTATPAPGWLFQSWSGDVAGNENPTTVTMDADRSVSALFVADTTELAITDVNVAAGADVASITWQTTKLATTSLEYGTTPAYNGGTVADPEPKTAHEVQLTGLTPDTTYHFRISATDGLGESVSTGDATFTTQATLASGDAFASDDFDAPLLDPVWTVVNPLNDGSVEIVGAGSGEARLSLSVPGVSHDPWKTNRSLRVMQNTSDVGFVAEAAFASLPTQRYQMQGLIVEQDASNWLRFDVHHDGSSLRAFAARTVAGASAALANVAISTPPDANIWLRVARSGSNWAFQYSYNGAGWLTAGSFSHAMTVAKIGPFVGNSGTKGAVPPHTALVDYVFDLSAPIIDEDGVERHVLDVSTTGDGTVTKSPNLALYPEGTEATITATPAVGWLFDSWSGDATGSANPLSVTMDADHAIVANFVVDPTPPEIRGVTVSVTSSTATVRWRTSKPATSAVAYGLTTGYELGTVSDGGLVLDHQVQLTGLAPDTTYHYAVSSTDALDQTTTTSDASFTTAPEGPPLIDVWYGDDQTIGALGRPSQWFSVLGNVSDVDGMSSLHYSVNSGPLVKLKLGPDKRRLAELGDFNIELPYENLVVGDNTIVLRAVDTRANVSTKTVTVSRESGNAWPLPYDTDWGSASSIHDRAHIADGKWVLQGDTVRPTVFDYDRFIVLGDLSWTDYEMEVPITVHWVKPDCCPSPSGAPLVGVALRWQGHSGTANPRIGVYPNGAFAWYRWTTAGKYELYGNNNTPVDRSVEPLPLGVPLVFKARVETVPGGTQYSFKTWPQGEPEPNGWELQIIEDAGPASGAVGFYAHHVDASFGDVTVVPLPD